MAERKNRYIMEAVKSMIHDKYLPMYLLEQVPRTTVYVENRISYNTLGNKNPKEMFTEEKPKVIHLKIFGCLVYIHIHKEKRSNLYPLGKKSMFV